MKPLFNELSEARLQKAIDVMHERGEQYGDTLRNGRYLKAIAVAKVLGFNLNREEARAIVSSGFSDVKYDRFEGGYKDDHIEDGMNYDSVIPGLIELAKQSRIPSLSPEIRPIRYGVKIDYVYPSMKIHVIKAIREQIKEISLRDAKNYSESIGEIIARFDSVSDAEDFAQSIHEAGADVTTLAI